MQLDSDELDGIAATIGYSFTDGGLLRRALSQATGREVRLEVKVDSELIGGATAKVGDVVFDGTLSAQLSQLRANLTKGS